MTPTPEPRPHQRSDTAPPRPLTLEARQATEADAHDLAPRLRAADLREIEVASGRDPLAVLLDGLRLSPVARVLTYRGRVVAMYGAAAWPGFGGEVGCPWMLASDELPQHPRAFLRLAPRMVGEQLEAYPGGLYGIVDVRNHAHMRWIEWAGFTLGGTHNLGRNGEPFRAFWRKANV